LTLRALPLDFRTPVLLSVARRTHRAGLFLYRTSQIKTSPPPRVLNPRRGLLGNQPLPRLRHRAPLPRKFFIEQFYFWKPGDAGAFVKFECLGATLLHGG
jgi:hypothetical protein